MTWLDTFFLFAKRGATILLVVAFLVQIYLSWLVYLEERVVTVSSWVETDEEAFPEMTACVIDKVGGGDACDGDLAGCYERAKGYLSLDAVQSLGPRRINSTHSESNIPVLMLTKKKVQKLNRCSMESVHFGTCYNKYIRNQLGCRLPWEGEEDTHLQQCRGAADTYRYLNLTHKLYQATEGQFAKLTGCLPPCHYFSYTLEEIYEQDITIGEVSVEKGRNWLSVYYKGPGHVQETEVLMYDIKDLVADIGGYLGLLLGFSALNVVEYATEMGRKKFTQLCSK